MKEVFFDCWRRKKSVEENQRHEKSSMEDTTVSPKMICINLVLPKIRGIHRFCTNQYWVNITREIFWRNPLPSLRVFSRWFL